MNHLLRSWRTGLTLLMGIAVFLFWYRAYPHALSYQEQYQLMLLTGSYLAERTSVPGGVADWLGEFVVQFYVVEWLGAVLLALVFVALQRLTWRLMRREGADGAFVLSFVPPGLLLWLLGDPDVLLSYAVALMLALGAAVANPMTGRRGVVAELLVVPLVYWLAGPMAWLYVVLRLLRLRLAGWLLPFWLLALQMAAYQLLLTQWPLASVLLPMQFYRIPLQLPMLMWMLPLVVVALAVVPWRAMGRWAVPAGAAAVALVAWLAVSRGYDRDLYELIRQDYLVRHERWDDIVRRASEVEVRTPFWSNCVNLALAEKRLLADRMFDFYQSGDDALLMPRVRDLTSMLPSAEAFWRLGMVNSAQRYMFDTQESILNGRQSGRCTKRIAECMLVNGHYRTASKQLRLLKHTLFYRSWAREAERLAASEALLDRHPVYGRLRRLRYKENFLYSYEEMDKMLGMLFVNNPENRMALDYFMGQMLLKGDIQGFSQYMGWVQQYGGYRQMPLGYQDALRCIREQGRVSGSPYAAYVGRMMAGSNRHAAQ